MEPVIGVIGCGGIIGKVVTEELLKFYKVKGAQRSIPKLFQNSDKFEWIKTDLYNKKDLYDFCKKCTIIINCAGPSYKIKDRIADAAIKNCCVYFDLSDNIFTDKKLFENINNKGTYIIGTGYVPGISGAIPKIIANKEFDEIDTVYCFQGGRQMFTKTMVLDIILNSLLYEIYQSSFYQDGKIEQEPKEFDNKIYLPGFFEPVYIRSCLSKEIIEVAKDNNIREIHWYNAVPDQNIFNMINKTLKQIRVSGKGITFERIEKVCEKNIFEARVNNNYWSTMLYEFYGVCDGVKKRKRLIVTMEDSNIICGQVAAETIKMFIKGNYSNCVYWGKDILDYDILDKMKKFFINNKYTLIDIPYYSDNILSDKREEDYI
ncbi:saccharopine dehydrogenase family protein [Clostridium felsineum]|uniref:saccharopine dehydrogenase NADP-binding domain-containing protein n=1 Tax=Clostridium felsineum TaxID=36839 RepID=UPI00098BD074|nr:saccharopine dehydrogenase NADP-binding domain-containing protein [Clostridium felsineum]URZ02603.1 hypothetical protein CLAUR_026150 [Clostridium felsineum]